MNKWARNRKRLVLAIFILFVVVVIGVPAFFLFYKAPTCFDGRQNGDEAGVDCGGSCQLLCRAESLPLLTVGDPRILTLSPSAYQVVAVVENSNNDAEISRAGYVIKLYDSSSVIPVETIEGETFVPKGATFVIFEGPIALREGGVPRKATLEWKEKTIVWKKVTKDNPELRTSRHTFTRLDSTPRLEADLTNSTLETVSNIDLVALVSDKEGNIFAASKTFVDLLPPGERAKVVFTWPTPFAKEPTRTEIMIRVFPDRSLIR